MPLRHDSALMEQVARDIEILGVTEACRRHGIHRSSWYRHAKSSPSPLPGPVEDREHLKREIRAVAMESPAWGCDRIAYYLSFSGHRTSSPTVQKLLVEMGLGRRSQREAARRALEQSSDP